MAPGQRQDDDQLAREAAQRAREQEAAHEQRQQRLGASAPADLPQRPRRARDQDRGDRGAVGSAPRAAA
jgi:hypothetical protein